MSKRGSLDKICRSVEIYSGKACVLRNFEERHLIDIVALERLSSSSPWSMQNFSDSVSSSHICVGLFTDSHWLAYAVFSIAAQEAELLILGVDPQNRGRKLATCLLREMELLLACAASQIFLEVRESNAPAIALYESLGFNCLGERKGYYPPAVTGRKRETARIYGKCIAEDLFN